MAKSRTNGRWSTHCWWWTVSFTLFASISTGAQVSVTPQNSVIKTGDGIAVTCQVNDSGNDVNSNLQIRWTKVVDGQEVEIGASGRIRTTGVYLFLEHAEKGDSGAYKCSFGTDFALFNASVIRKITFDDTPTEQHPMAGRDAVIECRPQADSTPLISWSKDGQTVGTEDNTRHSVDDNQYLVIKAFDKKVDDGIYKCDAFLKDKGHYESLSINVTGYVPPGPVTATLEEAGKWEKGVLEGATKVRLSCTATGMPPPTLKWRRGKDEVIPGDGVSVLANGVLEFETITPSHAGTYQCEATNEAGQNQTDFILNVYLKPRVDEFNENSEVEFSNDFTQVCKYSGDETLSAVWTFMGTLIAERPEVEEATDETADGEKQNERYVVKKGSSIELHIQSASLDDAGEYNCTVTNDAASVSRGLVLQVKKAPEIPEYTKEKVRCILQGQYTIYCEASGVPTPTISWMKKGGPVINDEEGHYAISDEGSKKTLMITTLTGDDFGIYVCKAENTVGQPAQAEIELMKIETPDTPDASCGEEFSSPTSISLKINTFSSSQLENKQPTRVNISVIAQDGQELPASVFEFASDGIYRVTKLQANQQYSLNVTGENEAGVSSAVVVVCKTAEAKVPGKPMFTQQGPIHCTATECILDWTLEETGGADIEKYYVEYSPIAADGEPGPDPVKRTMTYSPVVFTDLNPGTQYHVKVSAVNALGDGPDAVITVIVTDESQQIGDKDASDIPSSGPSSGAIAGIVIIVILIIVILVDVACYYVNQCGLLMCICVNLCGKTAPEVKSKEAMVEEGAVQKEVKREEKQEKQAIQQEQPPVVTEKLEADVSESTPMIKIEPTVEQKPDTTV